MPTMPVMATILSKPLWPWEDDDDEPDPVPDALIGGDL